MSFGNLSRDAWSHQKARAKQRGIAFRLEYADWLTWWIIELTEKGPNARRGIHRGEYMMCRYGDKGAYEVGNINAGSPQDNTNDTAEHTDWSALMKAAHADNPDRAWLRGKRGFDHPKARAIITPAGVFGSVALAAEHYGLTRAGAWLRASKRQMGFAFAE